MLNSKDIHMWIYIYIHIHIWLMVSTPLKNMKVSWDDDIPNIWKVKKVMFKTTNQIYIYIYTYISMCHIHRYPLVN